MFLFLGVIEKATILIIKFSFIKNKLYDSQIIMKTCFKYESKFVLILHH